MTINYVEKYQNEFDQRLVQGSITAELETPRVEWLGAKSFKVTTLSTGGYKPHTRDKGFNSGTMSNDHKVYTLDFDRDIEFYADKADVDETNQALSAANISKNFITEHATPEMDAYRISKLATAAITNGKFAAEDDINKSNVVDKLKAAILPIRKYGANNIIIYVSSEVMDALERAEDFTRNITVTQTNDIDTRVTSLDGIKLVEAWDDTRFKTKFDFSDGFKPTSGTKSINFLIVAKPAVVAKVKFNSVYLFAPGQVGQGDGWLYQNRLYHDLFVMEQKKDGIYVSHKTS
ncbi:TPA: hypothetical protein TXZ07_001184 [Streptococcus suis]|nr:hypothetical protein [Streptococcus suis]